MTAARYLALSPADRAFYIGQAKAALISIRNERLYARGIYQERAGRRRTVMATLRLSEHNRRLIEFGRGAYTPSRWGYLPVARTAMPLFGHWQDDAEARAWC